MRGPSAICLGICAAVALSSTPYARAANQPPVIQHKPVSVALQGQSMIIKATVTDDVEVRSVTLFYSTSKDVAPFRLAMQPAGQNLYVCTVPDNLLSRATTMTYYLEAMDDEDQATETRWYTVSLQPAGAGAAEKVGADQEDSSSWKRTALIAGGVVVAGGAAVAIASGGGGGDSSGPSTNQYAGTYIGAVTAFVEFQGQPALPISHGMRITIDANGTVSSSDLQEGQTLTATLNDTDFTMTADLSGTNFTGRINYYGSVLNDRINGSVGGSVQTPSGDNGTCYGNFYAVRQ